MSNANRNPRPRRKSMQRVREAPEEVSQLLEGDVPRGRPPRDLDEPTGRLRNKHPLILAPLGEAVLEQYAMLHRLRGLQVFSRPQSGVFVVLGQTQDLVAGVVTWPTSGPYVLVEGLITNRAFPLRVRHRAVVACAIEVIGFCQQIGKTPAAFVRSASLVRMARRVGATVVVGAMALGPSWRAL